VRLKPNPSSQEERYMAEWPGLSACEF